MIVEPSNSQVDDKSYMPLVLVKNGVWTKMFTDGLIDCTAISCLKLPNSRYDYVLYVDMFNTSGYMTNSAAFLVSKNQDSIDLKINHTRVRLHAELITTEI